MNNNALSNSFLDISQDIDDNKSMISQAEVSFYGENNEKTIIHSNLSRTQNEEGREMINQYKVLNSIGRGSFGKVVKALNTENKKYYAIKVLKKSKMKLKITLSLGMANNFDVLNEVNIIKKMNHPNIVKLHEVVTG